MDELNFKVQVVTPLFSGGTATVFDVRPSAIKGQLRFWFRAMMGGVLGGDWREVKRLEGKVFGDAEQASKFIIRVNAHHFISKEFNFGRKEDSGIHYLGYGFSKTEKTLPKKYISPDDPNSQFNILFSFKDEDEDIKSLCIASLWLLVNFGGLGARTRRGFGGVEVIDVKGSLPSELQTIFKKPTNIEEISGYFKNNLNKIKTIFSKYSEINTKITSSQPLFSVISSNYWSLKILNNDFSSWRKAMNWIGLKFKKFREDHLKKPHIIYTKKGKLQYYVSKDYDEVKKFFGSKNSINLKLPIFGLPIQFRFGSLGGRKVRVRGSKHERRASPLFIRVFKLEEKYLPLIIKFKSQFLEDKEKLKIEEIDREEKNFYDNIPIPKWDTLDEFINSLPGVEVSI
jgi:CRISPR-associated protein Cmr1